jgi:hypothetical protein
MNPKNSANFTRGLFNKDENKTFWLQGKRMTAEMKSRMRATAPLRNVGKLYRSSSPLRRGIQQNKGIQVLDMQII